MTVTFESLPDNARLWVYTANRELTESEANEINQLLKQFTDQWVSHQIPVPANAHILDRRFLLIFADESNHGVSGCSTDASVRMVEAICSKYDVDFFDRFIFAYAQNDAVMAGSKDQIQDLLHASEINENTLFFDGLVKTKDEFQNRWKVPLIDSWIYRIIN